MELNTILWIGFNVLVLFLLALDLGVFHGDSHVISVREALLWTAFWIALGLGFGVVLYFFGHLIRPDEDPSQLALKYITGYLVEKSLSVDNIFVFLVIFSYFNVPDKYQHKTLFWGIIGALVMRAIFIFAGAALIERFEWTLYIFGAMLIYSGLKMMGGGHQDMDPGQNPVLRLCRKFLPITSEFRDDRFFFRKAGKFVFSPLFVVLIVIETTDIVFAIDSIPAIIGLLKEKGKPTDTFLIYTSNVFAILGLRALFFALAGILRIFHHLHYGLSAVLIFVGVKMCLENGIPFVMEHGMHISIGVSLTVICGFIGGSIIASLLWPKPEEEKEEETETPG